MTGLELHHSIPPHMWSISEEDLDDFAAIVRDEHRKGKILNDVSRRTGETNPYHDDPDIGPNMYMVNKHVIIPTTRAAGGMSWALMKNPHGLSASVFVTHGWDEGIYEFYRKVKRHIHGTSDMRFAGVCNERALSDRELDEMISETNRTRAKPVHIWCCFLANPQSWPREDLKQLLGCHPLQSPFAKALQERDAAGELLVKELWVLSNSTSSIYTRLWCVAELKIATDLGMRIVFSTLSVRSGGQYKTAEHVLRLDGRDLGALTVYDQLLRGFTSVVDAHCSDEDDKTLIQQMILGDESRIDHLIEELAFMDAVAALKMDEFFRFMREQLPRHRAASLPQNIVLIRDTPKRKKAWERWRGE